MSVFLFFLRWTARIAGLLIAGFFVFMALGEMASPHAGPAPTLFELGGIALLATATLALLAAWRWELAGALVSLAALAMVAAAIRGNRGFHLVLASMGIPGILYCADWLARRRRIMRSSS